jgi:hypothetical protein
MQTQDDFIFIMMDLLAANAREVAELCIESLQRRMNSPKDTLIASVWRSEAYVLFLFTCK